MGERKQVSPKISVSCPVCGLKNLECSFIICHHALFFFISRQRSSCYKKYFVHPVNFVVAGFNCWCLRCGLGAASVAALPREPSCSLGCSFVFILPWCLSALPFTLLPSPHFEARCHGNAGSTPVACHGINSKRFFHGRLQAEGTAFMKCGVF